MGWQRTAEGTGHVEQFWTGTTLDGEKVAVILDVTDAMVERACAVLEDAGYEDTGRMDREAVRDALQAALSASA